jgi:hypothetical protein
MNLFPKTENIVFFPGSRPAFRCYQPLGVACFSLFSIFFTSFFSFFSFFDAKKDKKDVKMPEKREKMNFYQ